MSCQSFSHHVLREMGYGLRVTGYGLRITYYVLLFSAFRFQSGSPTTSITYDSLAPSTDLVEDKLRWQVG